jgi:hypothetical protein
MTDVKEAVARLRDWSNNKGQTSIRSGDIDAVLEHLEDLLSATHAVLYKTAVANVDGEDCWRTQRLRNAYESFRGHK